MKDVASISTVDVEGHGLLLIAHLRQKVRVFVANGNDVRFPEDLKKALDSTGGVSGCQTAVVETNYGYQNLFSHRLKDVASISTVDVEGHGLLLHKAYKIGQGRCIENVEALINQVQGETCVSVLSDFQAPTQPCGKIKFDEAMERKDKNLELFPCTQDGWTPKYQEIAITLKIMVQTSKIDLIDSVAAKGLVYHKHIFSIFIMPPP